MSSATTGTSAGTARRTRPPVTREHVVAAALALVDREGLDELSLRKLGAELDVETMSLYKRVANKDDLLAGVAELVWNEVAANAPPAEDWPTWLRSFGHAIRAAVHNHPHAVPLLGTIEVLPVPLLEVIAGQLERASDGWPPKEDAVSAACAVSAFALGTAMTEVCLQCASVVDRGDPAATERQQLRRIVRALPEDAPDRVIETALAVCGCDADAMFEGGLDLIVRGCTAGRG